MKLPDLLRKFHSSGKISVRFRNINVILYAVISVAISIVMLFTLQNITDIVSKDYAKFYSSNTVGTLNTYFGSQIALVKKAANSNAVIEWFDDEYNQEKKLAAYKEMKEIINLLPSGNLYIGIDKTLHEFTVEKKFTVDDIKSFGTLKPGYFDDEWYFKCIASDKDYLLNVDIDKILHRKQVWLNYKVTHNGTIYGVLCTWVEFPDLVEKLFSGYDSESVRGLVIDEKGVIHMDSALLGNDNFLHYSLDDKTYISDVSSDTAFHSAVKTYLEGINGYFNLGSDTIVVELSKKGKYRYATIAPIASTTWSVVTFYNAATLFSVIKFLPLLMIFLAMLIIFIIATSFTSNKLIFEPFEKLTRSIAYIKTNNSERVYGIERRDEIGEIATTVQDMKDSLVDAIDKAHYDALTGLYNRRFLDENLRRIIKSLSRSGGNLSVMMLDIDFFKEYNDTYGHDIGDICLKTVADVFANNITREDDFVARYGGEEFVVVLPNTDENGARIMANRLLENVRECKILHEKSAAASYVTISIGITTGRVKHAQSSDEYIKRADEALYISKNNGRNKCTFLSFEEANTK